MSKDKYFGRYKNIIHCLEKGPATFDEIQEYLSRCGEIEDADYNLSQRTLQRDIRDIYRYLNIEILNRQRGDRKYYIASSPEEKDASIRLINYFELYSAAQAGNKFNSVVFPETRRPIGLQNFNGLLHAIQNKLIINFKYHRFEDDTYNERQVQPVGLKEARGRWYLAAFEVDSENLKTFGLDRITELEISKSKYRTKHNINLETYFAACFGILHSKEGPQRLRLRFSWDQGQYIVTYPLHGSQRLIMETEEFMDFELEVCLTFDLMQEILSYGSSVEVLSPKSFRNEILGELQKATLGYKKGL